VELQIFLQYFWNIAKILEVPQTNGSFMLLIFSSFLFKIFTKVFFFLLFQTIFFFILFGVFKASKNQRKAAKENMPENNLKIKKKKAM